MPLPNWRKAEVERREVEQAARVFVRMRKDGVRPNGLLRRCRPGKGEDANAVVAAVTRRAARPVGGRRVAFLYEPRRLPLCAAAIFARPFSDPLLPAAGQAVATGSFGDFVAVGASRPVRTAFIGLGAAEATFCINVQTKRSTTCPCYWTDEGRSAS